MTVKSHFLPYSIYNNTGWFNFIPIKGSFLMQISFCTALKHSFIILAITHTHTQNPHFHTLKYKYTSSHTYTSPHFCTHSHTNSLKKGILFFIFNREIRLNPTFFIPRWKIMANGDFSYKTINCIVKKRKKDHFLISIVCFYVTVEITMVRHAKIVTGCR